MTKVKIKQCAKLYAKWVSKLIFFRDVYILNKLNAILQNIKKFIIFHLKAQVKLKIIIDDEISDYFKVFYEPKIIWN